MANGKPILKKKNDNAALRLHFANFHQDQINPQLSECYQITYVFKPYDPSNLDIYESQWIHKLKAKININKTNFFCNVISLLYCTSLHLLVFLLFSLYYCSFLMHCTARLCMYLPFLRSDVFFYVPQFLQ